MSNINNILSSLCESRGTPCFSALMEYLNIKENELKDELIDEINHEKSLILKGKIRFIKEFKSSLNGSTYNNSKNISYFK